MLVYVAADEASRYADAGVLDRLAAYEENEFVHYRVPETNEADETSIEWEIQGKLALFPCVRIFKPSCKETAPT